MQWRPIAEIPAHVEWAVVFDPDNIHFQTGPDDRVLPATVRDERVISASRHGDGTWWVDGHQGGDTVEPTHFLDCGVPQGCPATLDLAAFQAEHDRRVAERATALARRQAEAPARAIAQAAREEQEEAARAAYWAERVARGDGLAV